MRGNLPADVSADNDANQMQTKTTALRDTIAVIPFAAVKRHDGSFAFAEGLEGSRIREGGA
jgi:hypothetical protein